MSSILKQIILGTKYRFLRLLLLNMGALLSVALMPGQPLQREWVKTYYNVQSKLNQPAGIRADLSGNLVDAGKSIVVAPDGNVVVAGTSQNAEGDFDYIIVKYKSNGDEAWRARYGSGNQGNDQLRSMTIDPSGNVIVTGTSDTVKFNSAGSFIWAAPIGGSAVVANMDYVYVTGLSATDIVTAQLQNNNVNGEELWRQVFDGPDHGVDLGQAITLDTNGNVYVAGQEEFSPCISGACHRIFAVVSYASDGSQRWSGDVPNGYTASNVQARSIIVQANGLVYVYGTYAGNNAVLAEFSPNGSSRFWDYRDLGGAEFGGSIIKDVLTDDLLSTGTDYSSRSFINRFNEEKRVFEDVWTYTGPSGLTRGMDIVQDSRGNSYVAGYSRNDATSRAMFLAKITASGQQFGLDRFNSPNAGSNFGTGVAIDANDNVYVTGYVQNTLGGSEIVTIKYSAAPKIEKKPSGTMHLEFHTIPGQQYAIEASTNFFNWESLIINTADVNGLIQFDDTTAATIPYRFYRGNSSP